jgi:hypothetical protein
MQEHKRVRIYVGLTASGGARNLNEREKAILTGKVDAYFDGFSVFEGQGRWKGVPEPCRVYEIILTEKIDANLELVRRLAVELRDFAFQECVLVTLETIIAEFI